MPKRSLYIAAYDVSSASRLRHALHTLRDCSGLPCNPRTRPVGHRAARMGTLYVDRQDVEIRLSSGSLSFYVNGFKQGDAPLTLVERVVIGSRTILSGSVLSGQKGRPRRALSALRRRLEVVPLQHIGNRPVAHSMMEIG